jgi:hypothetical protein
MNKVLSFSVLSVKLASYECVKRPHNHREKPVVLKFVYQIPTNKHLQASKNPLFDILSHLPITTVQPPLFLTSADWLESQLAILSSQPVLRKDHEIQRSNLIKNQQQFRQHFSVGP